MRINMNHTTFLFAPKRFFFFPSNICSVQIRKKFDAGRAKQEEEFKNSCTLMVSNNKNNPNAEAILVTNNLLFSGVIFL